MCRLRLMISISEGARHAHEALWLVPSALIAATPNQAVCLLLALNYPQASQRWLSLSHYTCCSVLWKTQSLVITEASINIGKFHHWCKPSLATPIKGSLKREELLIPLNMHSMLSINLKWGESNIQINVLIYKTQTDSISMSQMSFNLRYLVIDQYDTYIVHLMAFSDQMAILYHKKATCQWQSLKD